LTGGVFWIKQKGYSFVRGLLFFFVQPLIRQYFLIVGIVQTASRPTFTTTDCLTKQALNIAEDVMENLKGQSTSKVQNHFTRFRSSRHQK